MHVLYIHQYFTTRDGAGGTRSYEMARALISRGHKVTILCGSTARSVTGLNGPFARGYRSGVVDGIEVVEFDVTYSNHDGILARAQKFVAFALFSVSRVLTSDYDLAFATSTPLTAAIPGTAAAILARKPFVFEIRDLWPELPRAMGMTNPLVLGPMHVLEWAGYRAATRMIALAPGIADGIARKGVSPERIAVVPNGCDLDFFSALPVVKPSEFLHQKIAAQDFVAVFAGAHGVANGLEALLDAAEVLKRRGSKDIKLLLVGDGARKAALIDKAQARSLNNVIFQDSIPKAKMAALIKGADLGLQILADVPAFYRGTSPNKFFDYLAAGRPVLINYPGWLAEFVEAEGCGFVVPPRDPDAFASALEWARDNPPECAAMQAAALALARREFDRAKLATRFCQVLEAAQAEYAEARR